MQLLAATAAFLLGAATALPQQPTAPAEEIKIDNLTIRRDGSDLQVVDFTINGGEAENLQCTLQNPVIPTDLSPCDHPEDGTLPKYQFKLLEAKDESETYRLGIYHRLTAASGRYGETDFFVYCHAGGAGPNDYACIQTGTIVVGLDRSP